MRPSWTSLEIVPSDRTEAGAGMVSGEASLMGARFWHSPAMARLGGLSLVSGGVVARRE